MFLATSFLITREGDHYRITNRHTSSLLDGPSYQLYRSLTTAPTQHDPLATHPHLIYRWIEAGLVIPQFDPIFKKSTLFRRYHQMIQGRAIL